MVTANGNLAFSNIVLAAAVGARDSEKRPTKPETPKPERDSIEKSPIERRPQFLSPSSKAIKRAPMPSLARAFEDDDMQGLLPSPGHSQKFVCAQMIYDEGK